MALGSCEDISLCQCCLPFLVLDQLFTRMGWNKTLISLHSSASPGTNNALHRNTSVTCTHWVHLHLSHDTAEVWMQLQLLAMFIHSRVSSSIPGLLFHQSIDVSHMLVQLARRDDGCIGDLQTVVAKSQTKASADTYSYTVTWV